VTKIEAVMESSPTERQCLLPQTLICGMQDAISCLQHSVRVTETGVQPMIMNMVVVEVNVEELVEYLRKKGMDEKVIDEVVAWLKENDK
jgi:hypothetical protein